MFTLSFRRAVRAATLGSLIALLPFAGSGLAVGQETPSDLTPEEIEGIAAKIDRRVMAPCCNVNTLDEHDSGLSREMRTEIRQWLREGKSEDEILAVFVERHGDGVLAMPDARGIALLGYLAPLWMAAIGIALMGFFLWRWQRGLGGRSVEPATANAGAGSATGVAAPFAPDDPAGAEDLAGDAEYERRLQQQLDDLDR